MSKCILCIYFWSDPQLVDRVLLLFIPDKNKPDYDYVRHIPNRRIHLYTGVQLLGVVVLMAVMTTEAAILFPIMVSMGIVSRHV